MVLSRMPGAGSVLAPGGCDLLPRRLPQEGSEAAPEAQDEHMSRGGPKGPSGAALRAARKATGLSQTALGAKAGIGRHAVSYWECKLHIDRRAWAVQHMAEAAPRIRALLQDWLTSTRARGMGLSLPDNFRSIERARNGSYSCGGIDDEIEAVVARELSRIQERQAQRLARLRVACGAKTTRKGTPCRNMSEPGRRRCKHHGGMSTGPRTEEGKARIAEAQRRRWAALRRAD